MGIEPQEMAAFMPRKVDMSDSIKLDPLGSGSFDGSRSLK